MNAMYWLILLIVLVVIEIITLGLTTIWFAGGALVTFILAMLDVSPVIQWVVFCAVSLGKTAVVTAEIHNLEGRGEVFVNGLTWTARTEKDSEVIPKDAHVEIIAVEGVKLIVREKKEG